MLGVFSIFGEKASRLSLFSRATKIGGPPLRTYPVEKLLPTVRPPPPLSLWRITGLQLQLLDKVSQLQVIPSLPPKAGAAENHENHKSEEAWAATPP